MRVSKETVGCRVGSVSWGRGRGKMLFSLPSRSTNTVFSCTLYDELFVQLSLLVPLLPEGYTAFDTYVRAPDSPLLWRLPFSSMKLSPNGRFADRVPRVSVYHS